MMHSFESRSPAFNNEESVQKLRHIFQLSLKYFDHNDFAHFQGILFLFNAKNQYVSHHSIMSDEGEPSDIRRWKNVIFTCRPADATDPTSLTRTEKGYVIHKPIVEDEQLIGYVGFLFPKITLYDTALVFLSQFVSTFFLAKEHYLNDAIHQLVEEVKKHLDLDKMMDSLAAQIPQLLGKGDCTLGFFDWEKNELRMEWSSAESFATPYIDKISPQHSFSDLMEISRKVLQERMGAMHHFVIPILHEDRMIAVMGIHTSDNAYTRSEIQLLSRLAKETSSSIHHTLIYSQIKRDSEQRDSLFRLSKKIHASITVEEVLKTILENMNQLYPEMDIHLWLAHDEIQSDLPVKQVNFQENNVITSVFMEAKTIVDRNDGLRIATPLRGKQAIYGVFELHSKKVRHMREQELEYISLLADTAGSAFENAHLYDQSQTMIRNLVFINDITQQLNKTLKMDEILQYIIQKLASTFESGYCCILEKDPEQERFQVKASTDKNDTGLWLSAKKGHLHDIYMRKEPIILGHNLDTNIQEYRLHPFRSLLGTPLIHNGKVIGAVILMDETSHYFTYEDYKLLNFLGQNLSLSFVNATLHSGLEKMVITDHLTGLYSRNYLDEQLNLSLQRDSCGSLILIDIDYFKRINDTYGHQTGDQVLRQVAQILKENTRDEDISARWGGEELTVYLPTVELEKGLEIAERIRTCVETQTDPQVTISIGVTSWTNDQGPALKVEKLFHQADMALYRAKNNGRNQCVTG